MYQIMTAKSQSVEDIINETKNKWQQYGIDKPLSGQQHKEFFESARAKLDPAIYKGESGAYRSDDKTYESGNQVIDRMSKQSDDMKDWIAEQVYEAGKKVSPKGSYNFQRDTVNGKGVSSKYSGSFENIAKQYLMGEGKGLYAHLKGKGRDFYNITKIGTANLEGAIAALAIQGDKAALIGDKNFDRKISKFANNYGVSKERAISYVMAHEFTHASQKGKYGKDHIAAELDVELTLKEYFTAKGDKDLADIASDRASKVTSNYASMGTYASPKGEKNIDLKSHIGKDYNKADKGYNGNVIKGNFGAAGKSTGYSGKAAA